MARHGRAERKATVRHVAADNITTVARVEWYNGTVYAAVAIVIINGNRAVATVDFVLIVQLGLSRTPAVRTLVLED